MNRRYENVHICSSYARTHIDMYEIQMFKDYINFKSAFLLLQINVLLWAQLLLSVRYCKQNNLLKMVQVCMHLSF